MHNNGNIISAKPVNVDQMNGSGNISQSLELSCQFEGKPLPTVQWLKAGSVIEENPNKYEITVDNVSDKSVKSLLKIFNLDHGDNGTYLCHSKNAHNSATAIVEALVLDVPEVTIDKIVAVSSSKLYINWTVVDWNTPVTGYILSYRQVYIHQSSGTKTILLRQAVVEINNSYRSFRSQFMNIS